MMCGLKSFFGGLDVHEGDLHSTDNFSIFAGKMFYALNGAVPANINIVKILWAGRSCVRSGV